MHVSIGQRLETRTFTNFLKIPIQLLRSVNIRLLIYLDDILVLDGTLNITLKARNTVIYIFQSLGFHNKSKKLCEYEYLKTTIDWSLARYNGGIDNWNSNEQREINLHNKPRSDFTISCSNGERLENSMSGVFVQRASAHYKNQRKTFNNKNVNHESRQNGKTKRDSYLVRLWKTSFSCSKNDEYQKPQIVINRKCQLHQNTSPIPKILLPTSNLVRYRNPMETMAKNFMRICLTLSFPWKLDLFKSQTRQELQDIEIGSTLSGSKCPPITMETPSTICSPNSPW